MCVLGLTDWPFLMSVHPGSRRILGTEENEDVGREDTKKDSIINEQCHKSVA